VNDGLLGKRRVQVSDRRSADVVGEVVEPGLVDTLSLVVRVGLEVVDHEKVSRGEAPDRTGPRAGRLGAVQLIDAPVISLVPLQLAGIEGRGAGVLAALIDACGRRIGIGHRLGVGAEIDVVLRRGLPGAPVEDERLRGVHGSLSRIGSTA
jgi:hypothetical protein